VEIGGENVHDQVRREEKILVKTRGEESRTASKKGIYLKIQTMPSYLTPEGGIS